jgi:3-oxoacyl-[acyl-carrier-protein] synthase-3
MTGAAVETKVIKSRSSKITGVVTCTPSQSVSNDYFCKYFDPEEIAEVSRMTGVFNRFWVTEETTGDLCIAAGESLLEKIRWDAKDVDAVIFISQSPDYVLPPTSIRIMGALGIPGGPLSFDVNLGCSGYPYGLFLSECLIQSGAARKVLLFVGETTSKIIDKSDKSTAMIFGDAGTATAIEAANDSESMYILGSDAAGERHLIVPESRFSRNTVGDPRLNNRDPSFIFMDGAEVFNFTIRRVPGLIAKVREVSEGSIDFFLFHQANKFMLDYLIKKSKLDTRTVPINIDQFGNTSSASIPLLLTTALKSTIQSGLSTRVGMFGFGVGFSWGVCVKDLSSEIVLNHSVYGQHK